MNRISFVIGVLVGVVKLAILTGCGDPGYMTETQALSRKIRAINSTNDLSKWAVLQIEKNLPGVTARPAFIQITNPPPWVGEIYPGYQPQPRVVIVYEAIPGNDHIGIGIANGREVKGMALGATNYDETLPDSLFYTLKCAPGIYVSHGRGEH